MTTFTPEQERAIQIAHDLADMGVPIFSAFRNHSQPLAAQMPFHLPSEWQHTKPGQVSHNWISRWKPGMALCMVTGVVFDVIDVDPRNGGDSATLIGLIGEATGHAADYPTVYGEQHTPSSGSHALIARTHLAKGKPDRGIDLQAGADDGQGRGFVFLAPTVRVSKFGPREDQEVAYEWAVPPELDTMILGVGMDPGLDGLIELCQAARPARARIAATPSTPDEEAFFDSVGNEWTAESADRVIDEQLLAVEKARPGEINSTLGGAARMLGRFVAGGYVSEDDVATLLTEALAAGGVHDDGWNVANGKSWTADTVIAAGLANGAQEPWTVTIPEVQSQPVDARTQSPARESSPVPTLQVTSAADMAYWLQSVLGSGTLSGFFLKGGQVVHTPRVDELGYVAPREGKDDDNGPAQIQAVTAGTLAAKIQYAHACYKTTKDKETGEEKRQSALFPQQAAQRAVDAPEAMVMLRGLRGITHTPMVRADGSVLGAPGYDRATGYLFLPGPGVNVPEVPEEPTGEQVGKAVALLDEMVAGFPFESSDDRANYYGLLLTPLLRLVTPPSYKMFGIGAHQPGSGKTLLADVATILHGGVLRSEMPEDEPEMRKQTTSILSTTSAPIVHIDNVTGVLRSSTLAGMLTAGQPLQDRELGSNRMITTVNDRVWVVTGNNLSLGGDLVRRTIIITIDPNMANPETRSFAIADLKAWVKEHRNELLWALLVMIRHWVARGRPLAARSQSDSFAAWEATTAGILAACGVPGAFDAESGKKAAAGGDDDGLAQVLGHIWERFGDKAWTVHELLDGVHSTPIGDFVAASRDWLPSTVLDRLARSEAGGRKSLGKWLMFRAGRWVTDGSGAVVLRQTEGGGRVAYWKVERKG